MENNFFDQFFAKSDGITTLEMHTQHVIIAGKNLLNALSFTPEERMYWSEKLYRCSVLHDLGKIHSEFQRRLQGAKDVSIRHEIISLWFCENFLDLPEDELFAIATHHKGIMRTDASKRLEMDTLKSHMKDHLISNQDLLTKETLQKWLHLMKLNLTIKVQEVQPEISKQSIRILHYSHQSTIIEINEERKRLSLMRALMIASDHIGSARMENEVPSYKPIELKDFQPKDKNQNLLPFRKFQENLQNITFDVILHAPTGSGKTEAALSWVYANQVENARLFYLLPYTASINAMVCRLQKVFGKERVTALHSKTLDFFYDQLANEESNDEKSEEKDYAKIQQEAKSKKFLSAELFYPVKVATLHQILKTSLKGKGWELALYDYKNALFIIDEFHTYNALLTGMLLASIKLFRNLFKAKFFFMSATIPDFMLNKILNEVFDGNEESILRPKIEEPSDKEILDRKRHILHCKENKYVSDEITLIQGFLIGKESKPKSVIIIVNNVKTAQELYGKINFGDKERVKLLHSGFNKKDRTEIEKSITHKDVSKRPQLLIATQAVEVSLDIDYDVAFIENAPIDALIQRLGRVNRAGTKVLAPIYLFENIIGNTPFYDDEVLKNTWDSLQELNNKELSEQDLVGVCNKVYEKGYNENQRNDFEQGLNNTTIRDFETDWIAGDWDNWIESVFEKDNQKIEVLCSNLLNNKWDGQEDTLGYNSLIEQKRYIEANQLFVSVYFYETKYKKDENREILISYDLEYDNKIGYKSILKSP